MVKKQKSKQNEIKIDMDSQDFIDSMVELDNALYHAVHSVRQIGVVLDGCGWKHEYGDVLSAVDRVVFGQLEDSEDGRV